MKIWMSGEVQDEVDDKYATARRLIEKSFNDFFLGKTFGAGLSHLAYLAIILKFESVDYSEVKKYRKKKSSVEFRLKISYEECLSAGPQEMISLVATSVRRAIGLLEDMNIPDFDCTAFNAEYLALAKSEGWQLR
jgi:hypothetical protein